MTASSLTATQRNCLEQTCDVYNKNVVAKFGNNENYFVKILKIDDADNIILKIVKLAAIIITGPISLIFRLIECYNGSSPHLPKVAAIPTDTAEKEPILPPPTTPLKTPSIASSKRSETTDSDENIRTFFEGFEDVDPEDVVKNLTEEQPDACEKNLGGVLDILPSSAEMSEVPNVPNLDLKHIDANELPKEEEPPTTRRNGPEVATLAEKDVSQTPVEKSTSGSFSGTKSIEDDTTVDSLLTSVIKKESNQSEKNLLESLDPKTDSPLTQPLVEIELDDVDFLPLETPQDTPNPVMKRLFVAPLTQTEKSDELSALPPAVETEIPSIFGDAPRPKTLHQWYESNINSEILQNYQNAVSFMTPEFLDLDHLHERNTALINSLGKVAQNLNNADKKVLLDYMQLVNGGIIIEVLKIRAYSDIVLNTRIILELPFEGDIEDKKTFQINAIRESIRDRCSEILSELQIRQAAAKLYADFEAEKSM